MDSSDNPTTAPAPETEPQAQQPAADSDVNTDATAAPAPPADSNPGDSSLSNPESDPPVPTTDTDSKPVSQPADVGAGGDSPAPERETSAGNADQPAAPTTPSSGSGEVNASEASVSAAADASPTPSTDPTISNNEGEINSPAADVAPADPLAPAEATPGSAGAVTSSPALASDENRSSSPDITQPPATLTEQDSRLNNLITDQDLLAAHLHRSLIDVAGDPTQNDVEFIPKATQLLQSPPPENYAQFIFMNALANPDDGLDVDMPALVLTTIISRSESVLSGDEAAATAPLLRPTSPTQEEEQVPLLTREVGMRGHGEQKLEGEAGVEMGVDNEGALLGDVITIGTADGRDAADQGPAIEDNVDREALIQEIKRAIEEKDRLVAKNLFLQNKLGEYFRHKRSEDNRDGEKSVTDQTQRYANCMAALDDLHAQNALNNTTNAKVVQDYKLKLQERVEEATLKAAEFAKYKRTIALSAENSRTGKPLPVKTVDQLEGTEQRKEAEVAAVRLENIKLRNKLKRHEQLLRQKEELADGLHLIDFEQLKIENQTYNEKIEERNEELLKLRKKITNIVQVLTHVKEKLQFVQTENVDLQTQLHSLDTEVSTQRDSLPAAKQERDRLRAENLKLRQQNGLLGNVPLLRDFEEKVVGLAELEFLWTEMLVFVGVWTLGGVSGGADTNQSERDTREGIKLEEK
ncbi:Coiled-coil domain-containing protein 96 [Quaeritorhiza haematococci]|nr:Coiled-coil domain-containing protein 96 [Quaeritorhiza haematococci]